jgi:glycosyltransferase involved in cell wall biosynthesis
MVSVVIPTYNRADSTIKAIHSVLSQTYKQYEVIVIDDGSTDGSDVPVQRFVQQQDGNGRRMFWIPQDNQGPSAARNEGIRRSHGELIAFLDSDDIWHSEKLEWQIKAFDVLGYDCGACCTDTRYTNNLGVDQSTFALLGRQYEKTIGIEHNAVKLLAKSFCGFFVSSLMARAEVVREVGGFNTAIHFAEDRDLFFRLCLASDLCYVNKQLVISDRSKTPSGSDCRPWDKVEVRLEGLRCMYHSWLEEESGLPETVRKTVVGELRANHAAWANWHLDNRRYTDARREVTEAIGLGVTPKMAAKFALTWIAPELARKLSGRPGAYL